MPEEDVIVPQEGEVAAPADGSAPLDGEDGQIEVEVIDDTPESERKPERKPAASASVDEDMDETSERVKKRISRLTYEKHETQRQYGTLEREHQALIQFAAAVRQQAAAVAAEHAKALSAWKLEASARREAELRANQASFVSAREANDPAKESQINAEIARLAAEKAELDRWTPQQYQIPEMPQVASPRQAEPQIAPADREWLENNPWFQAPETEDMRSFAVSMEAALEKKGYRPGTKECYDAIDASVRQAFPQHFSGTSAASTPVKPGEQPAAARSKPTSPVVGAPRVNGNVANKRVTLTKAQVATANKLGVSLTEYAKYVDKYV